MQLITTTNSLAEVCGRLQRHPFVTVDTEFLRESTYYPKLCVAQLASTDEAVVIDALASSGVEAQSISYIEAHATATALGDPIEVRALTQASP